MSRACWIAVLGFCLPTTLLWAGEAATLGTIVAAKSRVALEQIDHSIWDGLLAKYCDERGLVDYRGWKNSQADRQLLSDYLALLSSADLKRKSSRASQFAFWINAYNAVTIEGILREYPTSSIRNHTAKFFGYNVWDDLRLHVGGRTYSLNEIEHDVLRKMKEPRIHFAIVCASLGCPPLVNQAYDAENLENQLTKNAQRFFADELKFRYDLSSKTVWISPILDWFAEDFGEDRRAQLQSVAPYFPDRASRQLAGQKGVNVRYLDYDWNLNDQKH